MDLKPQTSCGKDLPKPKISYDIFIDDLMLET